eukprot:3469441-Prymnesium_polylepis.1
MQPVVVWGHGRADASASAHARARAAPSAPVPIWARRLHGAYSFSGSSVRDTRMVSPKPSASRAPIPMADFMRPSSPSPAS